MFVFLHAWQQSFPFLPVSLLFFSFYFYICFKKKQIFHHLFASSVDMFFRPFFISLINRIISLFHFFSPLLYNYIYIQYRVVLSHWLHLLQRSLDSQDMRRTRQQRYVYMIASLPPLSCLFLPFFLPFFLSFFLPFFLSFFLSFVLSLFLSFFRSFFLSFFLFRHVIIIW